MPVNLSGLIVTKGTRPILFSIGIIGEKGEKGWGIRTPKQGLGGSILAIY